MSVSKEPPDQQPVREDVLDEIVRQAAKGDQRAQKKLAVFVLTDPLLALTARQIAGESNVDDIISEVAYCVVRSVGSYEQIRSVRAWTYQICQNRSLDYVRREVRWRRVCEELADIASLNGSFPSQSPPAETIEALLKLEQILGDNTLISAAGTGAVMRDRFARFLDAYNDYVGTHESYSDDEFLRFAAETLDVSMATARRRLDLVRSTLKKRLGEIE